MASLKLFLFLALIVFVNAQVNTERIILPAEQILEETLKCLKGDYGKVNKAICTEAISAHPEDFYRSGGKHKTPLGGH